MMRSTTTGPWCLDRWRSFGVRCRVLRRRVGTLPAVLERTPGLRAPILDSLLRVRLALFGAMERTATAIEDQHGPLPDLLSIVHGGDGDAGETDPTVLAECRPPADGTGRRPRLSREQWCALGREIRSIRAEAGDLLTGIASTAGVTSPASRAFGKLDRSIAAARSKLDGLLAGQHPDWPEFARVFYGETESAPAQTSGRTEGRHPLPAP